MDNIPVLRNDNPQCEDRNGKYRCQKRVHAVGDHGAFDPIEDLKSPETAAAFKARGGRIIRWGRAEAQAVSARPTAYHPPTSKIVAMTEGYTGDQCSTCSGLRMQRTGTCSRCLDCGTSGGC